MNHNIYLELKKYFSINTVVVDPAYDKIEKLTSKLVRLMGGKGKFVAFSEKRLRRIGEEVDARLSDNAFFDFFHGSTPWLSVNAERPYALYLDCCFKTYIHIYQNESEFSPSQLTEIYHRERHFLDNAAAVFFSSKWAMDETKVLYNLDGTNFYVAGLGGALPVLKADNNIDEKYFLFVGLDFKGKGGDKVVNSFKKVRNEFPEFKLKIVGDEPSQDVLSVPGVDYIGKIDKSDPRGMIRLIDLYENAYCFVMPTSKDATPLVLVEALSLGCPVISMNRFGIPEIVKHRENGLLLEQNDQIDTQLESAMQRIASDSNLRDYFSGNAKKVAQVFNWENTVLKIKERLDSNLLYARNISGNMHL